MFSSAFVALMHTLSAAGTTASHLPPFPLPAAEDHWSVVFDSTGQAALEPGKNTGAAAFGSFSDIINSTGWALLDVHTSSRYTGEEQSYAAGFLEGALSHHRMYQALANTWGIDFGQRGVGMIPSKVRLFVAENDMWMRKQIAAHPEDPYWQQLGFLLVQRRGLADGYNHARDPKVQPHLDEETLYMLSLINADMDDLVKALDAKQSSANSTDVAKHFSSRAAQRSGHCSVLVQPAPDKSDLWVSHVTWDVYRNMLRVIKYFDMPLPGAAVRRVSFSSFPGNLYSADGFHVTDAGLTVVETTIGNYNGSLWTAVRPESVMTWARAMVANRLATNGASWTELQVRHNSGTCNNQWIVVDYKKFSPGDDLQTGLVWISETMPGHARREDVTPVVVRQGSWASFNIPYFSDIWKIAGYGSMQKLKPDLADTFSYTDAPRARMFGRERKENTISSLQSFMAFMRSNKPQDPLAGGDACNGISARCDLNPIGSPSYQCFGAHDAKATSFKKQSSNLAFYGVLSPTFEDRQPFAWSKQDASMENCRPEEHIGHPDVFNFGWYSFPDKFANPNVASIASYELGFLPILLASLVLLPWVVLRLRALLCFHKLGAGATEVGCPDLADVGYLALSA